MSDDQIGSIGPDNPVIDSDAGVLLTGGGGGGGGGNNPPAGTEPFLTPPFLIAFSNGAVGIAISSAENIVPVFATLADSPAPGSLSALDLTGATLVFVLRALDSLTPVTLFDGGVSVAVGTTGIGLAAYVRYDLLQADLIVSSGHYEGTFLVSLANGVVCEFNDAGLTIAVNVPCT